MIQKPTELLDTTMVKHTTHSYIRSHYTDDGTKIVFKCADPNCTHTLLVPKKNRSLIIGRATLCPECLKNRFALTSEDIKRKVPKCIECRGGQKAETLRAGKKIMENVLGDLFGKAGLG